MINGSMSGVFEKVIPSPYPGAVSWPFFALVAVFLSAYVGLALAEVAVPQGITLLAGAILGNRHARTHRPINGRK